MSFEPIPMTRQDYNKLKEDVERMESFDMIEITKRVAEARAMGDLSENAEYHAAREDQGMLQARIYDIKNKLSRAQIYDLSSQPRDRVVFGSRVRVRDLDLDDEEIFELVGPGSDNPDQNKILATSPIGQGLMGKKVGEKAEIEVPMGKLKFEIVDISFASDG